MDPAGPLSKMYMQHFEAKKKAWMWGLPVKMLKQQSILGFVDKIVINEAVGNYKEAEKIGEVMKTKMRDIKCDFGSDCFFFLFFFVCFLFLFFFF